MVAGVHWVIIKATAIHVAKQRIRMVWSSPDTVDSQAMQLVG